MTPEPQDRLAEYLDAFEAFAAQATPVAVEFALAVTRWEAIGLALIGLAALAAAIIAAWIIGREVERVEKIEREIQRPSWHIPSPLLDHGRPEILIPFAAAAALAGISAAVILLDVWTWIAIVRPDLAMIRDAMRAVGL